MTSAPVTAEPGEHIDRFIKRLIAAGEPVTAIFNDTVFLVIPSDTLATVGQRWLDNRELQQRRRDTWPP